MGRGQAGRHAIKARGCSMWLLVTRLCFLVFTRGWAYEAWQV